MSPVSPAIYFLNLYIHVVNSYCSNCDVNKTFHLKCTSCDSGLLSRGTTFIDVESGETISEQLPDDGGCDTCGGSKYYDNPCPCCDGNGKIYKYPQIELINDLTQERTVAHLDIAKLVAQGEMEIYVAGFQEISEYGPERAERRLKLGLNQYLNKQAETIGIDRPNALMVNQYGAYESHLQDPTAVAHWLNKRHPGEDYAHGTYRRAATPQAALEAFESAVSRDFLVPADKQGSDRLIMHRMRPVRSTGEAFDELRSRLGEHGYSLALGVGFIATEEYGPQLWAMTEDGRLAADLATNYIYDGVIETAIMRLRVLNETE